MTSAALERLQALLEAAEAQERQAPARLDPTDCDLDPRLHAYQVKAVQHLWDNDRAGLFLEMGLGKTATTLQALTPDHFPVLVVAPKRVAEKVWPVEVPKWRPDLSVSLAAGTPAKRAAALMTDADVYVIGQDNLKDIKPGQFRTIVLDELSGYKNRGSLRWKLAKKITDAAAYVYGLTGTPSPNGLMNLWAQAYLLDGGKALGRTLTSFRNRYFTPGRQLATGTIIEWNARPEAQERIEEALAPFCLSMRAIDHLDLPPVTYNRIVVSMGHKASQIYDRLSTSLVAQIEDQTHTAANAAVLTGKLSQVTAGFLYPDTDSGERTVDLHTEKIAAALEVVEGSGSPVLVFYRFTWERDALLATLPGARLVDDPGALDDWNRGLVPVLLAHPASAGHGLNLQAGGHTILWTTMPWSLEQWEQANARLARQGQAHPVVVHTLEVPGTVDEAIHARLLEKVSVQEALMIALKGDR